MIIKINPVILSLPKALGLHLFPFIFLLIIQLARQSINGNRILGAELSPQYEAQIVLAGGIRNGVIDWWWLLFVPLVHDAGV